MPEEHYRLRHIGETSLDDRMRWIMGSLAKELKITKKSLREASRIIKKEKFTDELLVRGNHAKITFYFGFRRFTLIRKGKRRKILAPHPKVQVVFQAISKWLIGLAPAHEKAYGFVKQRNVQQAARTLLGCQHFFSFDIADAFSSITVEMIEESLYGLGIASEMIHPLAMLVTCYYDYKRRLPQGSSCSPALLNLVYLPMCREIDRFCAEQGIKWFVYADDFNFAGKEITQEMKEKLLSIPVKFGFSVKPGKTRDNSGKTIPHLLGLTIVKGRNNRQDIHIKRKLKKKYRKMFFDAWKGGECPSEKIEGIAASIRQTYGKERYWPGWLRKPWQKYRAKLRRQERRKSHET